MSLVKKSLPYSRSDDRLAWKSLILSLAIAALGLAIPAIWGEALLSLLAGSVLFAVAALRIYAIQHDCGHFSYFTDRAMNDRIGAWLSLFTGIAFSVSRYNHNLHHSNLGDLSHREDHEVFTMSRSEYNTAPLMRRLVYRLYRHPIMLFLVGPIWVYFVRYRWPRNTLRVSVRDVVIQNVTMFGFWALIAATLGWWSFYAVLLGSYLAGVFGIFTVYVQHNFETAYWAQTDERDPRDAALRGSSTLAFGPVADFVLLNMGYHDLHHYIAKVPCYRLKECHDALASDLNHARIGVSEARKCLSLRLWDEDTHRMVPFPNSLLQDINA